MKILITGANGFLGSWLCKQATTDPNNKVFAAVRKNADIKKIENLKGLEISVFDYSSTDSISICLNELKKKTNKIDLVIHNAGLTKSTSRISFFDINIGITSRLIEALKKQDFISEEGKLCYVSSQAALGPVGYQQPISAYGESKLEAEKTIIESKLNYLIFRPTGIYGPGDSEFLPLFKSVKSGFYPCAAPINQKITLIHAQDVAQCIFDVSARYTNKIVHLSDGNVYSHKDLKNQIINLLNKKAVLIRIPNWITRLFLSVNFQLGKILKYEPILTPEKHSEISKDWNHDFTSERKEIPLKIMYKLKEGFADTLTYYQSKNLL